mgnify:CR=1 FL=1
MSQTVNITAASRDRAGKGAARAIRREGRVPGVIYGDKKDPQLVSLEYRELMKQVQTGRFLSTLVDIDIDGTKVRAMLSAGEDLPPEFARPEVAKILMKFYQSEAAK